MKWSAAQLLSNFAQSWRFSPRFHESRCVLSSGYVSNTGLRRRNEDRYFADARKGVFLVADGVGGRQGGEIASQILVDTLPVYLCNLVPDDDDLERRGGAADLKLIEKAITLGVNAARQRMREFSDRLPSYESMSSTVAAAIIHDTTLYVSHIGDSRVYRFSRGKLHRLTSDHTFVQALVDAGTITAAESRTHAMRNMVLNLVGLEPLGQPPKVSSTLLRPGDRILLATDGLTGVVDDRTLSVMLGDQQSARVTAHRLVDTALQSGADDNVTCVIVDMMPTAEREFKRRPTLKPARQSVNSSSPLHYR